MHCAKFDQRMHELLDERLLPAADAELLRHASRCARCEATMRIQQALFESIGSAPPVEPDEDFVERVTASCLLPPWNTASSRKPWLWIAAAAAIMAAAPVAWWRFRDDDRAAAVPQGAIAPVVAEAEASAGTSAAMAAVVEASAAEFELLPSWAWEWRDSWQQSIGLGPNQLPPLYPRLALPEHFVESLAPLRPLRDSVAAAVDVVRKSLLPRGADRPDARSSFQPPRHAPAGIS